MIQSVEKALQLLSAVAACDGWAGVRELARQTGLNASTAHHLLKTLRESGYLESDPETGRYRLGVAAVLMGARQNQLLRLAEAVKPRLDSLYDEIGHVVVGLQVERGGFVANYWKQDSQGVLFTPPPGTPVPKPHLMACGQILMAWQPAAWLDSYLAEQGLQGKLDVRSLKGSDSVDLPDSANGIHAIGVIVRGLSETPVMSIGWSMHKSEITDAVARHALESMLSAASDISAMLRFKAK